MILPPPKKPRQTPRPDPFGLEVLARLPLAESFYTVWGYLASDATLADFRLLRTKVNKSALNGRLSAYYLDSTWEAQLPSFKTAAETSVYQRLPDGTAILDGYPVVWTDVLQPYTTSVAADSPVAVFGAPGGK